VSELEEVAVQMQTLCRYPPGRDENYKNTVRMVDVSAEIRPWHIPPNTSQKHRSNQSALCRSGWIYTKKRAVSSYSYDSGLNGSPLRSAFDFCRTYGGVDTNTTVITKTNRAEQGLY